MDKVLVVIDVQNNFIKQCGAEKIIPDIVKKIKLRKEEGYEVLFTNDKSGGETEESVAKLCFGQKIFYKHSYGSEELILYLKNKVPKTIEFIGVCTDICVIVNVLAVMTFLPFSDIIVDSACCASENVTGHLNALKIFKSCNIKVI